MHVKYQKLNPHIKINKRNMQLVWVCQLLLCSDVNRNGCRNERVAFNRWKPQPWIKGKTLKRGLLASAWKLLASFPTCLVKTFRAGALLYEQSRAIYLHYFVSSLTPCRGFHNSISVKKKNIKINRIKTQSMDFLWDLD